MNVNHKISRSVCVSVRWHCTRPTSNGTLDRVPLNLSASSCFRTHSKHGAVGTRNGDDGQLLSYGQNQGMPSESDEIQWQQNTTSDIRIWLNELAHALSDLNTLWLERFKNFYVVGLWWKAEDRFSSHFHWYIFFLYHLKLNRDFELGFELEVLTGCIH